jgi:vitamin B12/bleomycin/antimicrobial peptide transport system ATP-binding/permease protein
MTASPVEAAPLWAKDEDLAIKESLFTDFVRMASGFWASRERNKLLTLAAALTVVIAATAYAQIRLNAWSKPFYDALTRKDVLALWKQLGVFAELAGVLLLLNVTQTWLNQSTRVVLRQGLVHDLMRQWLKPLRAFRLSNAGWIGVNPDQRMHADAQHLTELMTDLGIGLLQSTLLLASFIGVLWMLSKRMIFPIAGHTLHVPGYLVWCALFYAGTVSLVSWLVGRPLASLNAERYAREAELRFNLVRVNEEIEGITIYGGEADEKDYLNRLFEAVLEVSRRIVRAITRLTWITAGYGWFTLVAPILVAAPSYLFGDMSFGELMMVVGAFNQVQTSLRWFVDNFPSLADWRATLVRVASFRSAVMTMDSLGISASRIELLETADGSIQFDDLHVTAPTGSVRLSKAQVHLKPGARILIMGEHAAGRTWLFRAIIGTWPWGRGRISRPARRAVMFLPAHAHVSPGTLRAALAYPQSVTEYDDATLARALSDVGLEHLRSSLHSCERWDRRLNDDEKQCLAFARVIVQRPQWLVLNGALEALDLNSRRRIEALFSGRLASVGLINIGEERVHDALFTGRLDIVVDPQGPRFSPAEEQERCLQ